MRFCRSTSVLTASLLIVAACIFGFQKVLAGERGRSIEFSKSLNPIGTNQLTIKKDGLQDFESDLLKPFQVITPRSSLDGVVAPPVRPSGPAISSKKARELLQKKKEWIYEADPEMNKTAKGSSLDEFLNTQEYSDDGKDRKKMSPLDKYYEFLETKRKTNIRNGEKDKGDEDAVARMRRQANGLMDDSDTEDSDSKKNDNKEDGSVLKSLFKPDLSASPFAPKKGAGAFSDVFGLDRFQPTPDQQKEHREFMRQYQQLLGPDSSLGSLQPAVVAPSNPFDIRPASPLLGSDPFAPQRPQPIAPPVVQVPAAATDLKPFTQPAFTPPLVQDTPKPLFPTTTPFEAPRRKF